MRGRRRSLASVVLVCLVGALLAACTPTQDPFYLTPPAATGAPGDVLRSRTSRLADAGLFPAEDAWQILYRSTNARGQAIVVSGTVIVPKAPWLRPGRRPIVSFGVGTRGIGDDCAPSYTLANGIDYEQGAVRALLNRGYAVVVTDYEGLGLPGTHTYLVGQSQGRAALDIVRAAQRLPGTGLSVENPVALYGYSQGGATSAWAAELAPTYAPELRLRAAVMGGVPANLAAASLELDGEFWISLALLGAVGYDAAYPELDLETFLTPAGRELLDTAQDFCLVSLQGILTVFDTAGSTFSDYVDPIPLVDPRWQRRFAENTLGSGRPTVPVYQYHAENDQMVAFGQAETLRQTWCSKGVNVTWQVVAGAEHVLGLFAGQDGALRFLDDRLAGIPTSGNCPR